MIKAVSFDLWDTLFSNSCEIQAAELRKDAVRKVLEKLNHRRTEAEIIAAYDFCCHEFGRVWAQDAVTLSTAFRVEMIFGNLSVAVPEDVLAETTRIFEEASLTYMPKTDPFLPRILEVLHQDYKIGIISDTGFSPGTTLRKLLEKKNLLQFFSCLAFSDETGHAKPHESMFKKITDTFEIKPEELLHVGDLEPTDIKGALTYGAHAVLYTGLNNKYQDNTSASYSINTFLELPSVIETINKPPKKGLFGW